MPTNFKINIWARYLIILWKIKHTTESIFTVQHWGLGKGKSNFGKMNNIRGKSIWCLYFTIKLHEFNFLFK